ncbi:hypothetical protein GF406_03595 [candidate division KSB1 bacterium]|nr:hypothetical protein [candidate division KSB1 bacterium]
MGEKNLNDRLLTFSIIIFSVLGVLYFGFQAFKDDSEPGSDGNPYEYDIEQFKESGADLVTFTEINTLDLPMQHATALAIGPNDNLFVGGDEMWIDLDSLGRAKSLNPCGVSPTAMAVDEQGNLYLALVDHIQIFSPEKIKIGHWDSMGERSVMTSIALADDALFAADPGNMTVWKFGMDGTLLQQVAQNDPDNGVPSLVIPSINMDVAMDPDGHLWVVNPGRHLLENFTVDGDFRTMWGESAMTIEGFCGCCNPTHIAIRSDGSFVTAEKGIPRIKVYNTIGQLTAVVADAGQFNPDALGLDLVIDSQDRVYVLDPSRHQIRVFQQDPQKEG